MAKIVIGIHGLGNKPPQALYADWWKKSILDGLEAIGERGSFLNFEMVYWADALNPASCSPLEKDINNSFYLKEPYVPYKGAPQVNTAEKKAVVYDQLRKQMEKIVFNTTSFLNIDVISNSVMRHCFFELDAYYRKMHKTSEKIEKPVREIIRERLAKALYKHRKKEIMLIAHSMGSIIAYDVLCGISDDVGVHTFVTIGSPLAVPLIMKKLIQERGGDFSREEASIPENIRHAWYNIFDKNDVVTLAHRIGDYYKVKTGDVRVIDIAASNRYEYNGLKNSHKGYGYMVTPEFAGVMRGFLADEKVSLFKKLKHSLGKYTVKGKDRSKCA